MQNKPTMPIIGDEYLITAQTRRCKPKYGTQLFTFKGRRYRGCQLHGDFLGYDLIFQGGKLGDLYQHEVITVEMDEKDETNKEVFAQKVTELLGHPLRRKGKLYEPEANQTAEG